jgi:transcriptional regulator with XRE-family HTH domain
MSSIDSNTLHNFSERIAHIRKLAGVSRKYIQNNYGIHENTIKKWETSHTQQSEARVRLSTLREYLSVLEKNFGIVVTENWLFYGTDSKPFRLWLNPIYSMDCVSINSSFDLLSHKGNYFFFLNRNMEVTHINSDYKHILSSKDNIETPEHLSNIIGSENFTTFYPYFSKAIRGKKVDFDINFNLESNESLKISSIPGKNTNNDVVGIFNFITIEKPND